MTFESTEDMAKTHAKRKSEFWYGFGKAVRQCLDEGRCPIPGMTHMTFEEGMRELRETHDASARYRYLLNSSLFA